MRSVRIFVVSFLAILLLAGCTWAATAKNPNVEVAPQSIFDDQEKNKQMTTAKLLSTTIHVFDMDKTLSFFNGLLGLPVLQRFSLDGADIVLLGTEHQPTLSFIARPSYAETSYQGFSIAIETTSLNEVLHKLREAGYRVLREPFSPQPGSRLCFVEGPCGIEVELIESRALQSRSSVQTGAGFLQSRGFS